jgi:hypothetical protein
VARDVSAGLNEAEAGEQVGVAVDESVAKRWVIPVRLGFGEAGMAASREFIVCTLDDEFSAGECVVVAGVVDVEMGADNGVDLGGLKAKCGEVLQDVGFAAGLRSGGGSGVGGDSGVDENVAAGYSLDEVAGQNHLHDTVWADGDRGCGEFEEIELLRRVVGLVHR